MHDFRHILKSSAYLAVGSQLGKLVTFVQVLVLTRYLGASGYGAWGLIQAVPGMLIFMTDMGVNSLMLREIARDRAQERNSLQKVLSLKLFLAPVYVLAVYLVARLSGHESHIVFLITLYAACIVANVCGESIITVWRAHERFGLDATVNLVKEATLSLLLILVTLFGFGLTGLIIVTLLHTLLISVILVFCYVRRNCVSLVFSSARDYLRQLRASSPFAMYMLVNPLFMQIDLVMLGWMSLLSSVGEFNAAYRIILFLYFIPNALQRPLFPRLSLQYCSSRADYTGTLDKALRLVLLIGLPAAAGLCVTSQAIVGLLFSKEYAASAGVLAVLALSVPFYYVRVVMNTALYAANRERTALVIYAAATLLDGLLDYFLIPHFDAVGAALGSLVAEIILCAIYCKLMAGHYSLRRLAGFTNRVILACALMVAAVWLSSSFSLLVRVPLGVVVYVAALFAVRLLNPAHVKRYFYSEYFFARGRP